MGAEQVYVGAHYLGDDVVGALTGIGAAILVRQIYRPETRLDRLVSCIF